MKRIAHIISHFNIGGAQTMLVDIMNEQVKICNVSLVILTDNINESLIKSLDTNIKIICLHRKIGSKNKWAYIRLNFIIDFSGFDLIHIHERTIWNSLFPAPWVRCFQTVHNTGVFSKNFMKCKVVFAISQSVYEGLKGMGYSNVVLSPNGINLRIIQRKKSYSYDVYHPFRMVQVSRLIIEHKGQDLILKAMKLLKEQKRLPDSFVVDFVGDGRDRGLLENMVRVYDLCDRVNFIGLKNRDWVYEHLKDYDLFLQPSRYEGFGLTVAEAIAAGVPVLVSRNEGPDEIIDHGNYGDSFENENVDDLADSLLSVYNNYEHSIAKVKAGYSYINNNYSVESTVKTYLEYYYK